MTSIRRDGSAAPRPRIAVFCSSSDGLDSRIIDQIEPFARGLRLRGGSLVYGGGRGGLMGAFADAVLNKGLEVHGAITRRLSEGFEVGHQGLTSLEVVDDLFLRKKYFLEKSDGFFIYPGGFGTLDEALEVITWKGLGELTKPIVFVNIDGFWDDCLLAFKKLEKRGVIRNGALDDFDVVDDSDEAWLWWDRREGR